MREFGQKLVALTCFAFLLAFLAAACGITPDGLLYGGWAPSDDHPTNFYDTALHPFDQ